MKKGWKVSPLGEVLRKMEPANPPSRPDEFFDYIDVSSVSNSSFTIEQSTRLRGKDAPSRARRLVRAGDVLFATVRPALKRIAIVPESLDGQVCSTGYFVLRPKDGLLNKFLYYYLFTDGFMGEMKRLQKGANYPAVTDSQVKAQTVPMPPFEEQCRIVTKLDETFAGIATVTAHAEKNLRNARELFESTLHSVFAQSAEEYESVKLDDLALEITDGDHSPPPKSVDGVPFITISNIRKDNNTIGFTNTFKVPRDYFEGLKPKRRPALGDVLYTVTGSFGIPVLVTEDVEFCFQRHIGLIRPKDDVDSSWLYYLLMSPLVFRQATTGATGTAQKTVSLGVLRDIAVPKVPLGKQEEVVARLDALHAETKRLEAVYRSKLEELAELKQSILQKAFAGELH